MADETVYIEKTLLSTDRARIKPKKYYEELYTKENVDRRIEEVISTIPTGGYTSLKESFTATSAQTEFTLIHNPIGVISFFRNGVLLDGNATTILADVITYIPLNNGGFSLELGDQITILYQADI